jgi:hypothetical protein
MKHKSEQPDTACSFWRSRYVFGFVMIGAVAAYFLLTQHLTHVFFTLPFLLLLACPLMHVFMHHSRGRHKDGEGKREDSGKSDQRGWESL